MAIAFIQAAQNSASTTSTITATQTTSAGSMLIAFVQEALDNTSTVVMSDTSGTGTWVQVRAGYVSNGTTNRSTMFVKCNSAVTTSVTATWTVTAATTRDIIVFEFSGGCLYSATAEDTSVTNTQSAVTTATSASFTTSEADDVLIFACRLSGAFTSPTAGGSYTIPTNGFSSRAIMEYQIVTSTQSAQTATLSWTNSLNDANVFGAFRPQLISQVWPNPVQGPSFRI